MMDLMGKYTEEKINHAVFTLEENIKFMEQAVYMARHKEETCNEWDLKEEDFVCWMFGWMMGTLDSCAKDIKLIAALK